MAPRPGRQPGHRDAPKVVNDSWSFASRGCNLEFAQDIQACGPPASCRCSRPATSAAPARARPTTRAPFAVGSTTKTDAIADRQQPRAHPPVAAVGDVPRARRPGRRASARPTSVGSTRRDRHLARRPARGRGPGAAAQRAPQPRRRPSRRPPSTRARSTWAPPGRTTRSAYGRLDVAAAYQSIATLPRLDRPGRIRRGGDTRRHRRRPVALTATAVDAAGTTAAAEWFDGADPARGRQRHGGRRRRLRPAGRSPHGRPSTPLRSPREPTPSPCARATRPATGARRPRPR